MKSIKIYFALAIVAFSGLSLSNLTLRGARGQDEFDQLFDEMLEDFFPGELRKEIDKIRENSEPNGKRESFFKNDPKFLEIKRREILNRPKDYQEKQHPRNLRVYKPISTKVSESVFAVVDRATKKQLCLATAITVDGFLVTKADELKDAKKVVCVSKAGNRFYADVVKTDEVNDLAILKCSESLKPISPAAATYEVGTTLVTVENSNNAAAMGTLAVKPRSLKGRDSGFLGVEPSPAVGGVFITAVTRRSAAEAAGMRPGDIVTRINDVNTTTVPDFVREISSRRQGDTIFLNVKRGESTIALKAILNGRMMTGERAARFEMMRRLGAVLSKRNGDFPNVFQHDCPIFPEQCGGPVADLDGNVVGINIARAGRTSSYALPIDLVVKAVEQFKRK